ncbi:MAG: Zn-ribbon domain-containing OB-fold protein, partial [Candidatus Thermoplasmatota archaeon]|nr:Zn-ribbon domain-containing OB-fold protein [Candidatus Thermoplasmatota archaeon]
KRSFNPEAGRDSIGNMEDYQFKGNGKIVNSTVVHQAQAGYEMFGPYCMAIIELDEGPKITSQVVDCEPEMVKPGMKVKSVFRKLGEDSESGILHYGTKFVIDEIPEEDDGDNDDLPDIEV